MSSLVKWLETYVLPPASRLAQLRWLVAMRDTFISLLPITMAGSIAMLLNSIAIEPACQNALRKEHSLSQRAL